MRFTSWMVAILLFFLSGSIVFAAPKLQVDSRTYDFGEVSQGGKVSHVFEFTNAGDETLSINRVRSSCGCTAVLVSEKSLSPGGKGEVKATFDSTRFRGAVSKTIYVYSNDPVNSVAQLIIKGIVLEMVTVEPSQINFGSVAASQAVTATIILRNQGGKTLTLGEPSSTAAELIVEMTAETSFSDGDEVTLELQLTPKPGHDRFSGYVLVPIKGVPKNELRIPVYATITDN